MAEMVSSITSVFTAAIGWVGTVASTVADTPVLLVGIVMGFVGVGIGLFKSLVRT